MTYHQWIDKWLETNRAYGRCKEAVDEMAEAYPELTKVPGHAWTEWGQRAHWWLTTPEGEIIDPTESQFPGGVAEYAPWEPGTECQVGKCMNCGWEIWEPVEDLENPPPRKSICSDECAKAFEAYLNNGGA
jgi:hypothetical protein